MRGLLSFCLIVISTCGYGQVLEKKNVVIEGGWGFPPLNSLTTGTFNINGSNTEYTNIGTFIVAGEVLLSDRIGLNATGMYSYAREEFSSSFVEFDPTTGFSNTVDYVKTTTRNRFKFLIGPNFHLYRTSNLDTYLGLGFGVNRSIRNIKYSTQPPESVDGIIQFDGFDVLPIAIRLSYGLRYFLNEYWAIKAEFGLGGPIFNFSISTKIF